jgi:hypothetical protein
LAKWQVSAQGQVSIPHFNRNWAARQGNTWKGSENELRGKS